MVVTPPVMDRISTFIQVVLSPALTEHSAVYSTFTWHATSQVIALEMTVVVPGAKATNIAPVLVLSNITNAPAWEGTRTNAQRTLNAMILMNFVTIEFLIFIISSPFIKPHNL
jgi:hypothetical protein